MKSWRERLLAAWRRLRANVPLSREGSIWLAVAVVMLFTGLFKGINLVTLLACWMVAIVSWNGLRAGKQLRHVAATRVIAEPLFAASPGPIQLQVANTGRHSAQGLRVLDPAGGGVHAVADLPPGGRALFSASLELPRRGRFRLEPLRLTCGFPLGLAERSKPAEAGEDVVVFPRLGKLRAGLLRRFLSQESPSVGQARTFPRRHPAAQTEFHGLRPYRPGDSPRLIHWRTTARRGEMMIREFEDCPNDHLVLLVDLEADAHPEGEIVFERLLSLAATIVWEWCRHKGNRLVLAVAGARVEVLSGATSTSVACGMLEALALASPCPAVSLPELCDGLIRADLPPGPVLWLGTRQTGAAESVENLLLRRVACLNVTQGDELAYYEP